MRAVAKTNPDLVLADITLPDKNGLELIKGRIRWRWKPGLPILVLSMHDEGLRGSTGFCGRGGAVMS